MTSDKFNKSMSSGDVNAGAIYPAYDQKNKLKSVDTVVKDKKTGTVMYNGKIKN